MAGNDDETNMQKRGDNKKQDEDMRSGKRKRDDYCCEVCKLTSGWNKKLAVKEEKDGKVDTKKDDRVVVVDLRTFKSQVIMSVNSIASNLELSLDYLPCFKSDANSRIEGGFIAAGSSHGLLLFTNGRFKQSQYYICNPFNKRWVELPPAPSLHFNVHVGFIAQPCNNITSTTLEVLVVRFNKQQCQWMEPRSHFEVETYSSLSRQWTTETVSSLQKMKWYESPHSQSIFHYGRLHWPAGNSMVVYDPYKKYLLGVINPPSKLQVCQSYALGGISLSAGRLWITQFAGTSLDLRFWQLNGYDNHFDNLDNCYWRPMYKFNAGDLKGGPKWGPKIRGCCILGMHPHDQDIVYLKLCREHHRGVGSYLVDCNLRTKTLSRARLWRFEFQDRGELVTLA